MLSARAPTLPSGRAAQLQPCRPRTAAPSVRQRGLRCSGLAPRATGADGVAGGASAAAGGAGDGDDKSDEYSKEMQSKMGTTLTYTHENGLNYDRVLPDLIVGSCLQTPDDVDRLATQENVTTILCLQEDPDLEYFGIDIGGIRARCKERGDVRHVRFPVRDFDPFDLRRKLPKAVTRLARAHDPAAGGTVYIHCTAGLGRAPATALAYMSWVRGIQVDAAYAQLLGARTCSPKIEAVRSATADLLLGLSPVPATIAVYRFSGAASVQVAGLDVGWNTLLDLEWNARKGRFDLTRKMLPGRYQYKTVLDGHWTYSADHPSVPDGGHTNNVLEVLGEMNAGDADALRRILTPGGDLTQDERDQLLSMLCPWDTHGARPALPRSWTSMDSSMSSMDLDGTAGVWLHQ